MLADNISNQIKSLTDSFACVDQGKLEEFYQDILRSVAESGAVVISGIGKNVPICQKFVASLVSLGIPARFIHAVEALHGDIGIVRRNDIVLLVSKSGSTAEIIFLAECLKKISPVFTWLITSNEEAPAVALVNDILVLPIRHEGDPWNIVPHNSTAALPVLLQVVSLTLITDLGIGLDSFKKNHPAGAIGVALRGQ